MMKILISAVLFTIIWKLSNGITLNCTFGMSVTYVYIGSVYECDADILWDNENRDVITVVYGTHQNDRTNEHVHSLRIVSRGLESFPVNIAEFFSNIKVLYFQHNSISYVSNQHLIPCPNLVILDLNSNRITSLDSNLLLGLESMQAIHFGSNNIKHVGHDFILPNNGLIYFNSNPCIDTHVYTPDAITALRFSLLVNCPPTISQIEDTLENRPNWITNIDGEVQSLVNRTDVIEQSHSEMDGEVKSLTNAVVDLENSNMQLTNEVTDLRQNNLELINEMTELTDEVTDLQQSNLQLTNEVTDLQQSNVELTNRNSQLETRVAFLDTRAGYLEVRVAVLEGIIESKFGFKIDDVINENMN